MRLAGTSSETLDNYTLGQLAYTPRYILLMEMSDEAVDRNYRFR